MESTVREFLFAAALLALASTSQALAAEKVKIVAAENVYGDLASQIGGEDVEVTSILSNPDEDPHLFESSPSTARALSSAAIVIYNGADYDPWMEKLLTAAGSDERKILVAAELSGHKSGDNPHLWYDPKTLPAVAEALAGELARRDEANAETYKANLARFETSFAAVTNQADALRNRYQGIEVTATEPVFGYMARALGLKMLNEGFQTAIMNDSEPSPSQVIAFEKSLTDGSARVLFYNSQVSDETTRRLLKLATDNKVPVVGVTEIEPAGKTIQTWFAGQLQEVGSALGGLSQ
jgi:zinc/manganese transport system substrate-binding protein